MATATKSENAPPPPPHVAVFPCAGMGHLLPYLRLAAMLDARGCAVTVITAHPTVSNTESNQLSNFFATNPQIKRLEFQLLPQNNKSGFTNDDPFFIQREAIGNSVHVLHPLLCSLSPSLSAIVVDFPIITEFTHLASHLSIHMYTLIVTSAKFFSLMAYLPHLLAKDNNNNNNNVKHDYIEIPALGRIPVSSIPPQMLDPSHFFAANITSNVSSLSKLKGVLINTFTCLEPEAIEALKRNGVQHILPIGPLESIENKHEDAHNLPWLDNQAPESVLYISFGSRAAHSKDQLREFAAALEESGWPFLWVLKGGKVDKEDREEVEEILGASFLERTKKQGIVVKGWADQERILGHRAIGGFVSHCGWNSVVEAAKLGVPVLGWPPGGDQYVNEEVVEKAGFGLRVAVAERLMGRNEIVDMLMELKSDGRFRVRAKEVREKAREERESGGTSERLLRGMIDSLKSKET